MNDLDSILQVLRIAADYDVREDLFWHADEKSVTFYVKCNDLFDWGCADAEQITHQNIAELPKACADVIAAGDRACCYGPTLFCSRVRGMRPQGAAYPKDKPNLWPLFDACGPERAVDLNNPRRAPTAVTA